MDTINIGVLLPVSTILPVNKDFEKGLKDALKPLQNSGVEVEIVKEFIAQGDVKLIAKAIDKLSSFDDADLICGIVSPKAVYEVADKIALKQMPFLLSEIGGSIPDPAKLNDHIFINSPHLWQHAYALGYWGVKTFGKKGMFLGAVYDAGYAFSQMFYEGMMAADATADWSFSVPPMPAKGQLSDMNIILPFLDQYQPDFVFGAFCGEETTLFLNMMIETGWANKTKITGLPYLLEPFAPLKGDVTVYTTNTFATAELTANQAFYHLGRQSGQYIANAVTLAKDKTELKARLQTINTLFNTGVTVPGPTPINIVVNDIKGGQTTFTSRPAAVAESYGLNIEKLRLLTEGISAGWYNPYLCI